MSKRTICRFRRQGDIRTPLYAHRMCYTPSLLRNNSYQQVSSIISWYFKHAFHRCPPLLRLLEHPGAAIYIYLAQVQILYGVLFLLQCIHTYLVCFAVTWRAEAVKLTARLITSLVNRQVTVRSRRAQQYGMRILHTVQSATKGRLGAPASCQDICDTAFFQFGNNRALLLGPLPYIPKSDAKNGSPLSVSETPKLHDRVMEHTILNTTTLKILYQSTKHNEKIKIEKIKLTQQSYKHDKTAKQHMIIREPLCESPRALMLWFLISTGTAIVFDRSPRRIWHRRPSGTVGQPFRSPRGGPPASTHPQQRTTYSAYNTPKSNT